MKKKILVVGSISIDNTIFTKQLPSAGTTTVADSYFQNIGGKGANQACASLFLGGDVSFIGAIGKDHNGDLVDSFLKEQGLNARLKRSNKPTGIAFIILEEFKIQFDIFHNLISENYFSLYLRKNSLPKYHNLL